MRDIPLEYLKLWGATSSCGRDPAVLPAGAMAGARGLRRAGPMSSLYHAGVSPQVLGSGIYQDKEFPDASQHDTSLIDGAEPIMRVPLRAVASRRNPIPISACLVRAFHVLVLVFRIVDTALVRAGPMKCCFCSSWKMRKESYMNQHLCVLSAESFKFLYRFAGASPIATAQ